MQFVYPNFLWAYLLIAIPIIIHLFNFRRYKTVYFSRVKFLKEVTEDSRSGNKLKHLLVLFARILTIFCLVSAFAQPFIPLDNSQNTESVTSIYIDNSLSMQAAGQDGNLLNECKNKAIELVKSLDENEKVNLITSDLLSIHQRFYSKSEVIEMIKALNFSAQSTSIQNVLSFQLDLFGTLENAANQRVFLFSDFQRAVSEMNDWGRSSFPTFFYQAVPEQEGNLYIDSVWFKTPVHRVNTPIDIHYRVYNTSDEDQTDIPINLSINGNNPGPKRITVPAGSYIDDKIIFTDRQAGNRSGKLMLSSSQLFFDDEFYFSYQIKERVNILLITGENDQTINIEQLYGLDDYYNCSVSSINTVSQDDFVNQEFIILQNVKNIPSGISTLLQSAVVDGASVMLIPGERADLNSWNLVLKEFDLPSLTPMDSVNADLSYFNSADPLYTGVFEGEPSNFKSPQLRASYEPFVQNSNNFITLFGLNSNQPFLFYSMVNNGRVIVMTTPLLPAYSTFQNHALFAATMLRFAETATFQSPLYMEMGSLTNFPLLQEADEKNPIHMINEELSVDVIPQTITNNSGRVILFNHLEGEISQSGIYQLTNDNDFNEQLAINYNRSESETELLEKEEIVAQFEGAGWEKIEAMNFDESGGFEINQFKAKEYWRNLLILALFFIAIEILLLKFWKTDKAKN